MRSMRRWFAPLLLAAVLPLGGCDNFDPFGLYPEPEQKVVAPLELTGRVVDAADILDSKSESRLTAKLAQLDKHKLAQFVVVTTPTLEGREIYDYSIDLARGWALGDAKRDDGLMLLVAPREHKVRIEVGYGLEGRLSDPLCAEIIRDDIIPRFKEGDLQGGIEAGVDRLDSELRKLEVKQQA